MTKTEKTAASGHIQVIARPKGGFRRAGYNFSDTSPTRIPVKDLTEDQLRQIQEEPNLVVIEGNGEASAVARGGADTAALAEKLKAAEAERDAAHAAAINLSETLAGVTDSRDKLAERVSAVEAERDALAEQLKAKNARK